MSDAATRCKRYRDRRRKGMRVVQVELTTFTVERLQRAGWLGPAELDDPRMLGDAISDVVEVASKGRLTGLVG